MLVVECDILSFHIAEIAETLAEGFDAVRNGGMGKSQQDSDPRKLGRLLRVGNGSGCQQQGCQ
jgi:hypothetical protein